jgi:hypothetical protein
MQLVVDWFGEYSDIIKPQGLRIAHKFASELCRLKEIISACSQTPSPTIYIFFSTIHFVFFRDNRYIRFLSVIQTKDFCLNSERENNIMHRGILHLL